MAQPVWVLSVDLQTRTATFTSGLADAAKGAKTSFQDIKSGAQEMGRETAYSMFEARHGVMLLGEEFGIHLPRALTSFIAGLGPIGHAMEAAFPFLAIVVGATLLLEHLSKLKEKGEKLTESQINFGTTVSNVLRGLDDKLLQAGIRTDELNHNHLAALNKQLALIDHQSMDDLVRAFDTVAKKADETFAQLAVSWYQWGAGSAGAKNALDEFKVKYDSLLAQGKNKEANDLLAGTRASAERVLELQKQVLANQTQTGTHGTKGGDYTKFEQAANELKKEGIGYTEKEVQSQQLLVEALQDQVRVQAKVAALKAAESGNAVQSEHNKDLINLIGRADSIAALHHKMAEEQEKSDEQRMRMEEEVTHYFAEQGKERDKLQAEAGKEEAEHALKMGQLAVAAEREQGQLKLSAVLDSARARTAMNLQLEDEEYRLKLTANTKEIAALDKGGKDYENKLRALQNKELEMTREHENQLTQIKARAAEEQNSRVLSAQQRFIDATSKGLTDVIMRHESMAKMVTNLGSQMAAGMIQNAIKSMLAADMSKEKEAAAAARAGYLAGMKFPFPTNLVMAPTLGALGFATMMAYESGGVVPGVGTGDTVPAMLTPGEGVIPKRLMDGLTNAAKHGSGDNRPDVHIHHHATYHVQALDSAGVERVLDKHGDAFAAHAANHIRKMNH